MGAGCCRAHILPVHGYGGPRAPGPPPRPAWGPAWGTTAPDHSIASLRPGDKFHFHREPFIRQHLVVPDKPDKPFSANGVHNKAFTSDGSDGGELTVRPSRPTLPSLATPPASPAPVPPPRKKRRARSAHGHPHGPPPQPPSRTRAGSRPRDGDDGAEGTLNDSILSPANTMELLQRMAKADARAGVRRAGGAWRSMDSLDAVEARARSLPRPASTSASQHLAQSSEALDGPRSLDLDLDREGVVGVAAFTLQSWDERGSTRPWSPPLTTSAALLSPRQWRPLSAGTASTASTRAMSEFIRESYSSSGPAEPPAAQEAVTAQADAAEADGSKALPGQKALDAPEAPEAADQPIARAASPAAPTVTEGLDTSDTRDAETRPLTSSPASPGTASDKRADLLDVAVADGRPGSAASSTTESLGELENDIMHMLSTSGSASTRAGAEEEDDAKDGEGREEAAAVPASMLQQHRDAAKDAVPVPLST